MLPEGAGSHLLAVARAPGASRRRCVAHFAKLPWVNAVPERGAHRELPRLHHDLRRDRPRSLEVETMTSMTTQLDPMRRPRSDGVEPRKGEKSPASRTPWIGSEGRGSSPLSSTGNEPGRPPSGGLFVLGAATRSRACPGCGAGGSRGDLAGTRTRATGSGLCQDDEVVPPQAGQAVLAEASVPHRVRRRLLLGLEGGLPTRVVTEVAAVALQGASHDQPCG